MFGKKKEEYSYFKAFEEVSILMVEMAEVLSTKLTNYQLNSLEKELIKLHEIKQTADTKKQQLMHYLYEDFLPPIEREDIITMSHALGNALNCVENILVRMDMYQIEIIRPEMLEIMKLIKQAAHKSSKLMENLQDFKHPEKLLTSIEEAKKTHEQADSLHHQAVKILYVSKADSFKSLKESNVYDSFEKSIHSFEGITNSVEAIILKNT